MNTMNCRTALAMAGLTMAAAGSAFAQQAQDEAIRGCRAHAALSSGAYFDDVFVNVNSGGRRNNRNNNSNFTLNWEAWVSDTRAITGTCESDPRGTVVVFNRLAEHAGQKPAVSAQGGFSQNGGFNRGNRNQGGFNQPSQGGFNNGGASNAGMATLDNGGRGNFSGLGLNNIPLDHAHVVMQNGRALVTLAGSGYRVNLQGQVTRQISDREFEITMDTTDRGPGATGTILLRMTPAHNQAEELVINGNDGRQQFNGRFNQ